MQEKEAHSTNWKGPWKVQSLREDGSEETTLYSST